MIRKAFVALKWRIRLALFLQRIAKVPPAAILDSIASTYSIDTLVKLVLLAWQAHTHNGNSVRLLTSVICQHTDQHFCRAIIRRRQTLLTSPTNIHHALLALRHCHGDKGRSRWLKTAEQALDQVAPVSPANLESLIAISRRLDIRKESLSAEFYGRYRSDFIALGKKARRLYSTSIRSALPTSSSIAHSGCNRTEFRVLFLLSELDPSNNLSHADNFLGIAALLREADPTLQCHLLLTGDQAFEGTQSFVGLLSSDEIVSIQRIWTACAGQKAPLTVLPSAARKRNTLSFAANAEQLALEWNPDVVITMGGLFRPDCTAIRLCGKLPILFMAAQVNNYVPWWVTGIIPHTQEHKRLLVKAGVPDHKLLQGPPLPVSAEVIRRGRSVQRLGRETFGLPNNKFIVLTALRGRMNSIFRELSKTETRAIASFFNDYPNAIWVFVGDPSVEQSLNADADLRKFILARRFLVRPFEPKLFELVAEADCVLGLPHVTGGATPFDAASVLGVCALAYRGSDGASRTSVQATFSDFLEAIAILRNVVDDNSFKKRLINRNSSMAHSNSDRNLLAQEWVQTLQQLASGNSRTA
jgi:hypothetical protein